MKSQVFSFAAIALTFSVALPVAAQSTAPTTSTQRNPQMRHQNFLNLSAEQQTRMEQVRQQERAAIDAILTTEQKAQLQKGHESRRARGNRGTAPTGQSQKPAQTGENRGMPHPHFASLNLTADQRTRIEAVMKSSREQMDAILTPEQRQQMEQHRQQHEQRRQTRQNR